MAGFEAPPHNQRHLNRQADAVPAPGSRRYSVVECASQSPIARTTNVWTIHASLACRRRCWVLLLLTLGGGLGAPATFAETASVESSITGRVDVRLLDLASVSRLLNQIRRLGGTTTEGERAGAAADFTLLSQAVIGDPSSGPFVLDDLTAGEGPRALAMPGVRTRDSVAYQLLSLGYSAREAADVVSGRISKRALDRARRMLVVGLGQQAAADYLDKEYTRVSAVNDPRAGQARLGLRSPASSLFDPLIDQYANLHNVEATIVRAIIATESAFDPRARSRSGAIGLMQLMPATARELGVDPFEPAQNIEGGVRYFSYLLKMFGGVELALVAYNGGPGFAQRYARGETALYGETRDYVRRVLSRLQTTR